MDDISIWRGGHWLNTRFLRFSSSRRCSPTLQIGGVILSDLAISTWPISWQHSISRFLTMTTIWHCATDLQISWICSNSPSTKFYLAPPLNHTNHTTVHPLPCPLSTAIPQTASAHRLQHLSKSRVHRLVYHRGYHRIYHRIQHPVYLRVRHHDEVQRLDLNRRNQRNRPNPPNPPNRPHPKNVNALHLPPRNPPNHRLRKRDENCLRPKRW